MRGIRFAGTTQVALAALALFGTSLTYSSFSSSVNTAGNSFAAGTVALGDNDADSSMLQLTGALPGATDTGCLRVLYTGTLPASMRLYATTSGALIPYLTVTVTRGIDNTPSFDSCDGFVADQTNYLGLGDGVVYSGALSSFPSTWTTGLVDATSSTTESWATNEVHSYRVSVTLGSDTGAQGKSGTASFVWEARNQ